MNKLTKQQILFLKEVFSTGVQWQTSYRGMPRQKCAHRLEELGLIVMDYICIASFQVYCEQNSISLYTYGWLPILEPECGCGI